MYFVIKPNSVEFRRKMGMLALEAATMDREQCALLERQVRLRSVNTDLELDLPPSLPLPDGEEIPYGSSNRYHIRDAEQQSEISREYIRPPPNRTVDRSKCSLPYRSQSTGLLSSNSCSTEWPIRCHSMSRYTSGANYPSVILPNFKKRESAGLAKITMVPCLTDRLSTVSTIETSSANSTSSNVSISSSSGSRMPPAPAFRHS